jgi:imidazolonepropionase-like amidohydrolase
MMTDSFKPILILAGLLVDGTGRDPVRQAAVAIDDGRLEYVGPRAGVKIDRTRFDVFEFDNGVVMPGLIDAHCHLFYVGFHMKEKWVTVAVARAINNAALWLEKGVTTARDVSTRDNLDIGLREAIKADLVRGPRLFVSGSAIAVTGGMDEAFREQAIEVTGADEVRRVARQQLSAGADFIKLFVTGAIGKGGAAQMTFDEIRAAVEEAHKAGKHVAAHAIGTDGIKSALAAGVDTIEHGDFLDEEAVDMMASRGVSLVPTLSIMKTISERGAEWGRPPIVIENARKAIEPAHRSVQMARAAGIRIATGTDPDYADTVGMECAALIEAGLTPMEAIEAATRSGAEILGISDQTGTLEPGKQADVIVVNGNPLDDIASLERVEMVAKDGVLHKQPASSQRRL